MQTYPLESNFLFKISTFRQSSLVKKTQFELNLTSFKWASPRSALSGAPSSARLGIDNVKHVLQKLITNYENHWFKKTPILSLAQHWLPNRWKRKMFKQLISNGTLRFWFLYTTCLKIKKIIILLTRIIYFNGPFINHKVTYIPLT